MTASLLSLPDPLLALLLSHTRSARALGCAAQGSHRLRRLVADPRGLCWRLLRTNLTCQFQEAHTAVRRVCSPADEAAAALALADGCVLFPSGQVDLLLVPRSARS